MRSGPLERELKFPYHPHVTVAHDLPEEALDRAFDGAGALRGDASPSGASRCSSRTGRASGGRSATSRSAAGGPDRCAPPADAPRARADGDAGTAGAMASPKALLANAAREAARPRPPDPRVRPLPGRRRRPAGRGRHLLRLPVVLPDPRAGDDGAVVRPRRRRRRHRRRAGRRVRPGPGRAARAARHPAAPTAAAGVAGPARPRRPAVLRARLGRRPARGGPGDLAPQRHGGQLRRQEAQGRRHPASASAPRSLLSIGISAASGAFSDVALEAVGLAGQRRGDGRAPTCSASLLRSADQHARSSCSCSGGCRRCSRRSGACVQGRAARRRAVRGAQAGRRPLHRAHRPRTRSTASSRSSSACWCGSTSCPGCCSSAPPGRSPAPYDSDVEPSGTANAEPARKAGIPTEFADKDPDDPPTLQEDGAPSPLAAAVQGRRRRRTSRRGAAAGSEAGARRVAALRRLRRRQRRLRRSGGGTATLVRPEQEPSEPPRARRRWRCATRRSSPPVRSGWS